MATVNYLKARSNSLTAGGLSPVAAFTIPVTSGLIGAWLCSGGLSLATRNYATGLNQGEVIGTPTEINRTLRFGASCYLDTLIPESSVRSVLAICKRGNNAVSMAPCGSTNIGDGGIGLFNSGSSMMLRVGAVAGNVDTTVAAGGGTQWATYAAVVPDTGGLYQLHNLTTNVSSTSASTSDRTNTGGQTLLMGSLIQAPETWDTQMMALLISDQLWSVGDLALLKEWATAYAADYGIVV